jgi:hypothetical protein
MQADTRLKPGAELRGLTEGGTQTSDLRLGGTTLEEGGD